VLSAPGSVQHLRGQDFRLGDLDCLDFPPRFFIRNLSAFILFLPAVVCLPWSSIVCLCRAAAAPKFSEGCHLTWSAVLHEWAPQHGRGFAFDGHPNPYLSLLFPFALQHDVLFECIISLSRASWLLARGESCIHDRAFMYHHSNSLAMVRQRLMSKQECADDITILTVAGLTAIDVGIVCRP